jgi:hypothetical protein
LKILKALFRQNNGQSAIIYAVLLPVFISLIGLGIDLGWIIVQKSNLQNAVDLAALSAAQKIHENKGAVVSTAIDVAHQNGGQSVFVDYPYKKDNNQVEVSAKNDVTLFFSQVFGKKKIKITSRAAVKRKIILETAVSEKALDYAVFHGHTTNDLTIRGNGSTINGNIHANDDINVNGSKHTVNGNLSTSDDLYGNIKVNGTISQKSPLVPMPNINFDDFSTKADKVFSSNQIFNNVNISGIWLVNGDCTLNGGRITGKGVLLVTGDLKIAGNSLLYDTSEDLLAIYAQNNIQIAATGIKINGVLYAPNGQIRISGSNNTFYGALIASEVVWSTLDIFINANYDIRVPQSFTIEKEVISLIE